MVKIIVVKKVDSLYFCVSVVSVCVKVMRDVVLEVLWKIRGRLFVREEEKDKNEEDMDMEWGLGYLLD